MINSFQPLKEPFTLLLLNLLHVKLYYKFRAWSKNDMLSALPKINFDWSYQNLLKGSINLSRRRPISYRNQSTDLLCKSMDCFLYDIGLLRERVKITPIFSLLSNWLYECAIIFEHFHCACSFLKPHR